jgi:hypothetical protein
MYTQRYRADRQVGSNEYGGQAVKQVNKELVK